MSLHRSLTVLTIGSAAVALVAAIALVLLPTYLHRAALDVQRSLQNVRVAEEIQRDLLNYVVTPDEALRRQSETDLREKLSRARMFVNAAGEDDALEEASRAMEAYISKSRQGARDEASLEKALASLQEVVAINVGQADTSVQRAARWDRLGDWIGIGCAALLGVGVTGMLIWLGVFAFRPVFEIRDAMRSFGEGTRNARAPEHGPEELRLIAAQFNDMAETLERQQNNQLHFLAAVAHDLRNPLVALNLSAQILSAERASLPVKVSDLMSIIERQVHRLDRMIGDLLDRSRIEGGQLDVKMVECDARKIMHDAFDLFRSSSTKHKFVSQVPDSEVPIVCDPFRIEQVLNNLISNAIKYSPAGGEISLELKPDRDHVLFQVSDHGMGIAQEEVPYIFEPFRRVRSGAEDIPGVGLGLSVVRRIVQAHSGRIEVESRVGQGTTVRVYLPVERHKDASPLPVSSAHRL